MEQQQPPSVYPYGQYHPDAYSQSAAYSSAAAANYYAQPVPAPAPVPLAAPADSDAAALAAARAEIAALKAEIASLKAAAASSSPALIPPPQFYPPPAAPYGGYPSYPPSYGAPSPWGYGAPPAAGAPRAPPPATLDINHENKRGPKGANLAFFCIPNAYHDQNVYDLAYPYGKVVFCQVATHRDTGASRGYAFVSYDTVEEAEKAVAALHNLTVEGRALRVEVARADRESAGRPY